MAEHLLPPEQLRHQLDQVARAYPEQSDESESLDLREKLDVSLLEQLSPFDRMVVLGVYWGALSRRAVARAMRAPQSTVRGSLHRSLVALRPLCSPYKPDAVKPAAAL